MNLPENLSTAAISVYNLLSANPAPQSVAQLSEASQQSAGEEDHKAIATADSLVVKGIIKKETGEGGEATYSLVKSESEIGPNDEADAKEAYAEKTDANAEEKRMIDLLEKNSKKLSETQLFKMYTKEQTPGDKPNASATGKDVESALKELTEAGVVTSEGDAYSIKK